MPEAWGAASVSSFDLRVWDDEAVVFVQATADTHHLSPDATSVLLALHADPGTSRSAQAWYAAMLGADHAAAAGGADDAEESRLELSAFESLLLGLERIGVVVRRPA